MTAPFALKADAVIPPRPCRCTAETQAVLHRLIGADAASPWLDPFLALMEGVYAIGEAVAAQYPGFGAVIAEQTISIFGRQAIGQPAFAGGRVTAFDAGPKGDVFTSVIAATNDARQPFAEMTTTILLIDPAGPVVGRGARAPERPASRAVSAAELGEAVLRFQLTPEAVRAFDIDRPPSLHTDLEAARAAGFAKPIVSGNQVFSLLWKRLIEPAYAPPVALRFKLKRPLFWDDEISIYRGARGAEEGELLEVRNAGGKAAIFCEVSGRRITPGDESKDR